MLIPDWVADTPEDITYNLTMFDALGGPEQNIDLTPDEFIALKEHLAAMRGYGAPQSAFEAVVMLKASEGLNRLDTYELADEQSAAVLLETTRDFYRCVPSLVVCPSETLDAELAEMAKGGTA
ncbi:MAG: hypothetical protein JWN34_5994 [Bryobacterales bacterium]|jgi:hypothetical protein|nr:hypothetical protein [Bryobacterales bacterium]